MGRVLHFSDIHFGAENVEAVAAALAFAHAQPSDLMLVTGDITQSGETREFEAAAAWFRALPQPLFVIPGNHDTPYWDLIARLAWPWRRYEKIIGHPSNDHQFQTAAVAVRGVNTARAAQLRLNWSKGAIDLEQTRRAARALSEAPAKALKIIACHHPLIEMEGAPMTGDVRCGRAAAEIFAASGVDLVVTGHVHVPFALEIPIGDRRSHAVGAGTLSLRERGAPAGFNEIVWDEKDIRVSAMAWSGRGYEAAQQWTYKRRRTEAPSVQAAQSQTEGVSLRL
jgi:3',5'-cyclic AMP phosphodiesterase CpdA